MDSQRDADLDADQQTLDPAVGQGAGQGGGRGRRLGGGAVAVARGLPLWVWVIGALGALLFVTAFLMLGKATNGDVGQQTGVVQVQTTRVSPVTKPTVVEKPPVVGAFQPLDLANAPWLGSKQLMLAACLVLVAILFLTDSIMGGKREIRAFIVTILFAVLLLIYGGESQLTATILGILHQILLYVANIVLKYWQLVAAVVIVSRVSNFRKGGLTPIASFFIFLGIFGSLSGNLGELGTVLGLGTKTVLLPGEQVLKLAITQRWAEAGFTLACLVLLFVGVVIACVEARWKGVLLAVGGVFAYFVLRLMIPYQALVLAITFGLVLVLAVPLKAGKGRRFKLGQGSVSTPLDVVSVFCAMLAMTIIILGRV